MGGALHPYAQKAPQVKRGGDAAKHEQAVLRRRALVKIVDFLSKKPEHCLEVLAHIENLDVKAEPQKQQLEKPDLFSPQYTRLWRLPVAWWASWLVAHCDFLTSDLMMKVTAKSVKAPQMLAFFLCQLTGEDIFPKVLLDKKVASRTFACRARTLNRLGVLAEGDRL